MNVERPLLRSEGRRQARDLLLSTELMLARMLLRLGYDHGRLHGRSVVRRLLLLAVRRRCCKLRSWQRWWHGIDGRSD